MVVAAYIAWPYWSLYELAKPLESGDIRALRAAVDWNSVRCNLKSDLQSEVASSTQSPVTGCWRPWP